MSKPEQDKSGDVAEPKGGETTSKSERSPIIPSNEVGQHTQNYIEAYHAISEWIRFADGKAAVILTVGGAMAGLLIPTIHRVVGEATEEVEHWIPYWQSVTVGMFLLYVAFFLLSGIFAFLCINPFRQQGRHPALDHCDHFHPAAIACKYTREDCDKFVNNCKASGQSQLLDEVLAAILLDSHISNRKYGYVKTSLKFFATSVFFGFLYFLVLQF